MIEVLENDFDLKEIHFKKGKVSYKATGEIREGALLSKKKYNDEEEKWPAPELERFFLPEDGMSKYVVDVMEDVEYKFLLKHVPDKAKTGRELMPAMSLAKLYLMSCYQVTGIKLTGAEQSAGVVFVGYKTLHSGKIVKFETPAVNFTSKLYGWEGKLIEEIEELKTASYNYIIQHKHAFPPEEGLIEKKTDKGLFSQESENSGEDQ